MTTTVEITIDYKDDEIGTESDSVSNFEDDNSWMDILMMSAEVLNKLSFQIDLDVLEKHLENAQEENCRGWYGSS